MGKSNHIPLTTLQKKQHEKSAVIVIGSTGTGKSSTIAKCTGQNVRVGDGPQCVTRNCEVYSDNELSWVDTQGWDDMDADDTEIFQSILQFLNRHNLTSIRAIIWTVHAGLIRQDATLDKQAHLIDQFAKKDIWNNVVIVCKQAMNPEHEARGALTAGYAFNSLSKLQVVGYRYLEDSTLKASQRALFESQSPEMRRQMNVLNDFEVKATLMEHINAVPSDVQIIFNHFWCTSCGAEGDSRLMPPFCHMEKESAHPGTFIRKHPKATEPYHQAKGHISIHPGQLESPFFSRLCCTSKVKRYKCCNSQQADGGCVERWACCRRPLDNDGCQIRHECCQLDIEVARQGCETLYECCGKDLKTSGCIMMCNKCKAPWGTKANNCFQKPHDLEQIEVDI